MIRRTDRGYVRSFDDYVQDIEPFFQDVVLPDCRAPLLYSGPFHGRADRASGASPAGDPRQADGPEHPPLLEFEDLPFSMVGNASPDGPSQEWWVLAAC